MNALCNLSRKKSREVAASLPDRFLNWRCFTKLNLEFRNSINATTVAVAKITGKRGWRVRRFLADQKVASSWKKMCFGASYSTSSKLLVVAGHILTTGLQKCL